MTSGLAVWGAGASGTPVFRHVALLCGWGQKKGTSPSRHQVLEDRCKEPPAQTPDHAWPAPCTSQCSTTGLKIAVAVVLQPEHEGPERHRFNMDRVAVVQRGCGEFCSARPFMGSDAYYFAISSR